MADWHCFLPAEVIEGIFRRHDALFGDTYHAVYTTAIVLWTFLSQVLADGKLRSGAAAVARIADFLMAIGKNPPSTDTGAYCTARKKLSVNALHDLLVTWQRPTRPPWMDEATYATIPTTLTLRVMRFNVAVPGRRTQSITVVTTLLDPDAHPAEVVAELYGYRWNVELDIRAIKQTLNLDHLRCQTPEMVRVEFWTTLLAYNLVRQGICQAALKHGKLPRRISFTETCVTILAAWSSLALGRYDAMTIDRLLARIASLEIPDRPGRIEPRVLKRRRHRYPLMREPRQILKQRLQSTTGCDTIT